MQANVIGIAWYRREEYEDIRRIMEDASRLPPDFDSWSKLAEKMFEQQSRSGRVAVKAYIDPKTFPDWCRARGLHVDAAARMQYANAIAFSTHGQNE